MAAEILFSKISGRYSKNLNSEILGKLTSEQKQQIKELMQNNKLELITTTLIDTVVLPLLFYFCLFKPKKGIQNGDPNKLYAAIFGLLATSVALEVGLKGYFTENKKFQHLLDLK